MTIEINNGDIKSENHFKGYIIRACRHGESVEIYNLFPSTGGVYLLKKITYEQYLQDMQSCETLVSAYGK